MKENFDTYYFLAYIIIFVFGLFSYYWYLRRK